MTRELGAQPSEPAVTFEAVATPTNGGFELRLTTHRESAEQERRIRAASCDELVDALAAAVSLALQAASDDSMDVPVSSRPASGKPAPEPTTAVTAAPTRSAPKSPPLIPVAGAAALLDVGTFPDPAFGIEFFAGVGWSRWKIRGKGGILPTQEAALSATATGAFRLWFGGLDLCYVLGAQSWNAGGCLGGELGQLSASGVNVRNPRATHELWLAAQAAAWLATRPSSNGWQLFLSPGIKVPLRSYAFELTELGTVHTPAPVAFVATAGIELELR